MLGEFMPHLALSLVIQIELGVIKTEGGWNLGHWHRQHLETVIHLDDIVGVEAHVDIVMQSLVADKGRERLGFRVADIIDPFPTVVEEIRIDELPIELEVVEPQLSLTQLGAPVDELGDILTVHGVLMRVHGVDIRCGEGPYPAIIRVGGRLEVAHVPKHDFRSTPL